MLLLRILFALVCLTAFAPCQGGEEGQEPQPSPSEEARKARQKEARGKGDKGEEEEWEELTPEQRLARNVTNGASRHCRFVTSVKPSKIMPGASGVITVAALLQGEAVIPSPAPMEVLSPTQQGLVTLGALAFQPASPGRLAKGYLGRPVYDNYAVFEVPVTVSPDAEIGKKQAVSIDMRFDLYDGTSANAIGRFLDRVTAEVEVGRAPDPAVAGSRVASQPRAESPTQPKPAAADSVPAAVPNAPKAEGRTIEGHAAPRNEPAAAPAVEPSEPDTTAPLVTDDSDAALPVPMLIGGGVLLLGIVLLLARKK